MLPFANIRNSKMLSVQHMDTLELNYLSQFKMLPLASIGNIEMLPFQR